MRVETGAASSVGQIRGSMNRTSQPRDQKVKSKRGRELEREETCGQRVGGVNFITSEVEHFQNMTKSRVWSPAWVKEVAWRESH